MANNATQLSSTWTFTYVVVVVVPTPFMVLPTLESIIFLAKDGKQNAAECTWNGMY